MKTIPNAKFNETTSTVSLLKIAVNYCPPGTGLDFANMRKRLRVADAIEKVEDGGEIKLEDEDYKTAVECVRGVQWSGPAKHLIQFAEQFGL